MTIPTHDSTSVLPENVQDLLSKFEVSLSSTLADDEAKLLNIYRNIILKNRPKKRRPKEIKDWFNSVRKNLKALKLKECENFILMCTIYEPEVYPYLPKTWKGNKHIAESALKIDGSLLDYHPLKEEIIRDPAYLKIAIRSYPELIRAVDFSEKTKHFELALLAVTSNSSTIQHIPSTINRYSELASIAIRDDSRNLKYINVSDYERRKLEAIAFETPGFTFDDLSENGKKDINSIKRMLVHHPESYKSFKDFPPDAKKDDSVLSIILDKNSNFCINLRDIDEFMLKNRPWRSWLIPNEVNSEHKDRIPEVKMLEMKVNFEIATQIHDAIEGRKDNPLQLIELLANETYKEFYKRFPMLLSLGDIYLEDWVTGNILSNLNPASEHDKDFMKFMSSKKEVLREIMNTRIPYTLKMLLDSLNPIDETAITYGIILRNDGEHVLQIVKQHGASLLFFDSELRKNFEVVKAAVEQDPWASHYVAQPIEFTHEQLEELVDITLKSYPMNSQDLPPWIRKFLRKTKNREKMISIVKENPYQLKHFKTYFKDPNDKIYEEVARKHVYLLKEIGMGLRRNTEFAKKMIEKNWKAIKYLAQDILENSNMQQLALEKDFDALNFLQDKFSLRPVYPANLSSKEISYVKAGRCICIQDYGPLNEDHRDPDNIKRGLQVISNLSKNLSDLHTKKSASSDESWLLKKESMMDSKRIIIYIESLLNNSEHKAIHFGFYHQALNILNRYLYFIAASLTATDLIPLSLDDKRSNRKRAMNANPCTDETSPECDGDGYRRATTYERSNLRVRKIDLLSQTMNLIEKTELLLSEETFIDQLRTHEGSTEHSLIDKFTKTFSLLVECLSAHKTNDANVGYMIAGYLSSLDIHNVLLAHRQKQPNASLTENVKAGGTASSSENEPGPSRAAKSKVDTRPPKRPKTDERFFTTSQVVTLETSQNAGAAPAPQRKKRKTFRACLAAGSVSSSGDEPGPSRAAGSASFPTYMSI